jgi:lysophospholipid acyltransferase (LPLAT)-like uncharacterized protein
VADGRGRWFARLTAAVAAFVYRAYHATLRARVLLPDGTIIPAGDYRFDREIFALCERDALAIAGLIADAGCTVLVTIGRDGDWAAALLQRLGCRVVRGSSRRGGAAAFKGLLDRIEDSDGPTAIVVDGPLGPAGEAKVGAVACGMMTGRPVHAIAAAARRRIVFPGTWSGIYLPLPFSKLVVACDTELPIPEPRSSDEVDRLSLELTGRLAVLRGMAEEAVRRATIPRSKTSGF